MRMMETGVDATAYGEVGEVRASRIVSRLAVNLGMGQL